EILVMRLDEFVDVDFRNSEVGSELPDDVDERVRFLCHVFLPCLANGPTLCRPFAMLRWCNPRACAHGFAGDIAGLLGKGRRGPLKSDTAAHGDEPTAGKCRTLVGRGWAVPTSLKHPRAQSKPSGKG